MSEDAAPARLFATPAGVTPTYATQVILGQAAQLRSALAVLGELRMRKYSVKTAPLAAAVAAHAEIMAGIAAAGALAIATYYKA